MKSPLSERNLVVVLFVMVLITFAFAQEDSKKMEKAYIGFNVSAAAKLALMHKPGFKTAPVTSGNPSAADLSE